MADTLKADGINYRIALGSTEESPLVYLVHGRAGTIQSMGAFRRIVPEGFHVITVEAPEPDPIGGYSWWPVQGGRGDPQAALAAARRLAVAFTTIHTEHALRPKITLGVGFSQGAALLSLLLQEESSELTGYALLAGFVFRHPEGAPILQNHREVLMIHGSQDETIPIAIAEKGRGYLNDLGVEVEFVTDPVGHKVGSSGMRALKGWLASFEPVAN